MDLPLNQSVFDFDFTSEMGKKYDGQFTVLCVLDMKARHRLELEKTRLLGNFSNPTDELGGIAVVLANLRVRIVNAPEWWKQSEGGYNIQDFDALTALFDKVLNAETEWREKLKEKVKKIQETAATTPNQP